MPGFADVVEEVAARVARGALAPGAPLPGVRALAGEHGVSAATAGRAVAELARAGIVRTSPRRGTRVAADGAALARRLLAGGRGVRLAGSDDPALDLLVASAQASVDRVAARGSSGGLVALWQGRADAAALHLRHVGGEYNAPYASRMLAGRDPLLVRLWRREQGILLPPGNPRGVARVDDLPGRPVALRPGGTGTRSLLERLLRERGHDPAALDGPELGSHLEVALAVASGTAEAGVAVRSAARVLDLDFLPLAWEPFELALPAASLDALAPLLDVLADRETRSRLEALGGYDLEGAGGIARVAVASSSRSSSASVSGRGRPSSSRPRRR